MICPECKSEYVANIYQCPDCDVALVYELPPEIENHSEVAYDENFISIYSPANSQETALIKMILDREEIAYFLKNENKHGLGGSPASPFISNARIELYVPPDMAEQALEVLKSELSLK